MTKRSGYDVRLKQRVGQGRGRVVIRFRVHTAAEIEIWRGHTDVWSIDSSSVRENMGQGAFRPELAVALRSPSVHRVYSDCPSFRRVVESPWRSIYMGPEWRRGRGHARRDRLCPLDRRLDGRIYRAHARCLGPGSAMVFSTVDRASAAGERGGSDSCRWGGSEVRRRRACPAPAAGASGRCLPVAPAVRHARTMGLDRLNDGRRCHRRGYESRAPPLSCSFLVAPFATETIEPDARCRPTWSA